jgi:hypothetical protein
MREKTMSKKLFSGTMLILLIFIYSQAAFNRNTFFVSASEPSNLKIYVGPPSVLADNNTYESIFIQLQDSTGAPARALENTTIRLSSSLTSIGSVNPEITIPAGSTYAVANFSSTYTPGTTTITAAAPDYLTVQASITTAGPVPSILAVYGFPPVLPANGGSYPAVVVQLQDYGGLPARAPIGDVNVRLFSSNITVGTVDPNVTIEEGSTYGVATFTTTITTGSAEITAIASGYSSGKATITTQTTGGQPITLKVHVGPPSVPADGAVYEQVAVQLQDSSGRIAQAPDNITVGLSSSDTAVGTVDPNTTIRVSETYALANFTSTYKSGTTTITAAATNCESGQESLTTVGPIPLKLAVYCVPPSLPADDQSYDAILVQLQDSAGNPARDPSGNITVYLFSSTLEAGNVSSTLIIPYGETHSTASFFSTYTANTTTITALTSDYETGQATVTTYLIDQYSLNISVTAQPTTVNSSDQAAIKVNVTYNGLIPAPSAAIQLTSDNGGNFSAVTDEGNGYYDSVFTAPAPTTQTVCTILAKASKQRYTSGEATAQVTVNPFIQNASVTAQPTTVKSDKQSTITVYVTHDGLIPAPNVTIGLTSDNGGNFSAVTDEGNGYYDSVFTAPAATTQTVCGITAFASKPGYTSAQASVQVTVNPTTGNILLRVQETSGNPVSEANVTPTIQPTGVSQPSKITDNAGLVVFNGVLEGSYTIQIAKSGYDTRNETITVTAGQTTDTTINLTKTPTPLLSTPVLIAIAAIVIIALVVIVIVLRKYHISFSTSQRLNSEADH